MFLEKLAEKVEEKFMSMDVKKKLEKRELELAELENICEDFDFQLSEMHSNLATDINIIDDKKKALINSNSNGI